ncbi:MAG: UvrD-helicase domain-containing protein [Algicola sp.]|nr:UvrD-helicase domain-containing protein [Algicola sp.]
MTHREAFTIYNASAGSGKTFTLVKNYLRTVLEAKSPLAFKSLLALTFTNKAVNEMKSRIIDTLKTFSNPSIVQENHPMFTALSQELNLSPLALHQKAKAVLHKMVHNYAAFDISTIDKFNHKLVRTFAHDLKLPVNFEVELDTPYVLGKAVDQLIDKAGNNKTLTKVLVDFAIEKADDDKSWDIAYDFNNMARLLVSENDLSYLNQIKHKSLQDFSTLKGLLKKEQQQKKALIINTAQQALNLIDTEGITHSDFYASYLPKFFTKIATGDFNVGFTAGWQTKLTEGDPLYPKKVTENTAQTITKIQPQLALLFNQIKQLIAQESFLKNSLKNITPLSVLSAISQTLDEIKAEDDLLLISEFNTIIHNEINQQPAPFIYERLGEKFQHFFIDEFQDTSILQWQNLEPLIANALSGENLKGERGSLMLVGDAKQAIYRWRGGRAEQFIDLYNKTANPFQTEISLEQLVFNYRSTKTIVAFNNHFFQHIANLAFSNPSYQAIYQASEQQVVNHDSGYVELTFLDTKNEDPYLLHCQKTLDHINQVTSQGFQWGDICIITRKGKEGVAIATHLTNEGIDVISSESLLLCHSKEVNFMINMLQLSLQPKNNEIKLAVLLFLSDHLNHGSETHVFLSHFMALPPKTLFGELAKYHVHFNFNTFTSLPIYEAAESIVRGFNLNEQANAYVQFFLDEILDFSQKHHANISGFIELWERKKDVLSISAPQDANAVQIMTIHKSKGLEFPIVIFPFANQDIYFNKNPKIWFPIDEATYGFPYMYINKNNDLETYGDVGEQLFEQYQAQLELDAINLLYVVLTRAVKELYVISELDLDKKNQENLKKYSGLFIHYLKSTQQWQDSQATYTFGAPTKNHVAPKKNTTTTLTQFISTPREELQLNILTNAGYLWDTPQENAIEKGNLVHNIMAKINTKADVDQAFNQYLDHGKITETQAEDLKPLILKIVDHNKLSPFFTETLTHYNERDIILKDGRILRPDKITINKNKEAAIIDYKTGAEKPEHLNQITTYQYTLEEMGYTVVKKILVYINQEITIKEL